MHLLKLLCNCYDVRFFTETSTQAGELRLEAEAPFNGLGRLFLSRFRHRKLLR